MKKFLVTILTLIIIVFVIGATVLKGNESRVES